MALLIKHGAITSLLLYILLTTTSNVYLVNLTPLTYRVPFYALVPHSTIRKLFGFLFNKYVNILSFYVSFVRDIDFVHNWAIYFSCSTALFLGEKDCLVKQQRRWFIEKSRKKYETTYFVLYKEYYRIINALFQYMFIYDLMINHTTAEYRLHKLTALWMWQNYHTFCSP